MNIDINNISLLVTCSASLPWMKLEKKLIRFGYTLGYENESCEGLTVQELLQKNPSNYFESLYGQVVDNCVSLTVIGKDGKKYENKTVPRTAVGPDFRSILLSMGKRFGQIEEVTMRIYPLPELVDWHCTYWPSVAAGLNFVDELRALNVKFSFADVYKAEKQPPGLKRDKQILASLRFSGIEGMVKCYMEKASALAKEEGAHLLRTSKRKIIPLLEELMRKSVEQRN